MSLSIMIVDDSRISRQIMKNLLPPGEHFIREAGDGMAALDLYREARPDIVFLDLTMPGMDGFETLAALREIDPSARVVVVTADVQPQARSRVESLGAMAMLSKPTTAASVAELIARVAT